MHKRVSKSRMVMVILQMFPQFCNAKVTRFLECIREVQAEEYAGRCVAPLWTDHNASGSARLEPHSTRTTVACTSAFPLLPGTTDQDRDPPLFQKKKITLKWKSYQGVCTLRVGGVQGAFIGRSDTQLAWLKPHQHAPMGSRKHGSLSSLHGSRTGPKVGQLAGQKTVLTDLRSR